jgi:hypothetical protein
LVGRAQSASREIDCVTKRPQDTQDLEGEEGVCPWDTAFSDGGFLLRFQKEKGDPPECVPKIGEGEPKTHDKGHCTCGGSRELPTLPNFVGFEQSVENSKAHKNPSKEEIYWKANGETQKVLKRSSLNFCLLGQKV